MPGFDCIVGNPPFLNQLESATAADRAAAALVRVRSGGATTGYADLSAAFLEASVRWLAGRGRVAFVQPQSLLAARDAAPIRAAVLRDASLAALWISNERVFEGASVFTCAPVLERGGPRRRPLSRSATARFVALPPCPIDCDELATAETWSHLAAAASGIPEVDLPDAPLVGSIAAATADFRDQYYGLDGFLIDDAEVAPERRTTRHFPRLVTTGLVDLAECRWGRDTTRVLKRKWNAPRIDRVRMARDGTLEPWLAARLVPKVVMATQTRVIEVLVDAAGELVPGLPLITIVPHTPAAESDLWRIAAAIASPVATAVAFRRYAGAALSVDALKLSASQVERLPLPTVDAAWRAGAECLADAHEAGDAAARTTALHAFGLAMVEAYGLPAALAAEIAAWWTNRLDRRETEEHDGES
jgi:hypothetical protein